ncbi:MAG: NADH-quinone oxidoreductase subunit L [Candidatus Eisenbacteria bacterium]|uniref:NADH-quinone oxidoreductase subunit L n=1 Tax=Eiseniibacteriota bacterium TaxID=2212470 RepID=A0A948S071_UNCEI|nr:NADH-quinone oxidoreductase subunit L [Candidatus Eisenbacteria bacterium]MBU1950291.1 NADH-quinone oxidoreductase subunit L [Candidatus Eisenbacteria bacterium]MBU2692893.1 NADH-quinone oxidoreductase subunit L [Candidatus Eisenbacteria bacterium]
METRLWLIPALPFMGSALVGLLALASTRRKEGLPEPILGLLGCAGPVISFFLVAKIYIHFVALPAGERLIHQVLYEWISAGEFHLPVAFQMDTLSLTMLLFVTAVGSLIHIYSIGYMRGDRGFARYFSYLNLFMFSMILLVLGDSMLTLFVGWEGVGLCSYLLIGFWFEDPEKAAAGKKAFIVNRIGDLGFLLGIFLIYWTLARHGEPGLQFHLIESQAHLLHGGVATAAALLLFTGAVGKSAQIPLYVWLPDAMAGPTPVSALIHAATMVTAGVYMVARMNFLYVLSPTAMIVVATVGAVTALYAATIAVTQNDIKKVLAYSTVSQLGYMFIGVGLGAFSAGIFHVLTHAFFKAVLFLGAGSVIHAMGGEQDMRKMGGLAKRLPITTLTFGAGFLALAGLPPFAGFFSKDEILWAAFSADNPAWGSWPKVLWIMGLLGAALTAFYMMRAFALTFLGSPRFSEKDHHVHESPLSMAMPLLVLAAGSISIGFLGVPEVLKSGSNHFHHWLAPIFFHGAHGESAGPASHAASQEILLMCVSVLAALSGLALGFWIYRRRPEIAERGRHALGGLYKLVLNKYYVDELYNAAIIRPVGTISRNILWKIVDVWIIDGIVNLVGILSRVGSYIIRFMQVGSVQIYALVILAGVIVLLLGAF